MHDGSAVVVRPLTHADAGHLARFLEALSRASRRFSTFDGYDLATARELRDAIARHDKLRLVIEEVPSGRIVGLIEFSLDLTPADIARYRGAGIHLSAATDCRFGPTPADDHQDRGLGTLVLPWVMETAGCSPGRGSSCWGGVRADNPRAIRYYEKNGFQRVGRFTEADGTLSPDMMLALHTVPDPARP
ncbi:GNAT family N-acetyltransferase [Streptomyces sp. NPDC053707]|uniref:GNAT family N-acetyltransferase n=1 Tax=Streptomyces sp. NPDC053707 TaxID=3365712 RepID=UPI0037D7DC80